jgi:3-oxoacyl-[acyl-carrier-protein] synthase III
MEHHMKPESLYLTGLAAWVPEPFSAAEAVARGWYDPGAHRADGWLGAAVAGDEAPVEMGLRAATAAMRRGGSVASDIDIVLYADSMQPGPHGWYPQHYIERRVVGRGVPAIGLRQGCSGVLNGLDLAACYLAAVPTRRGALVVGAENFSADPVAGPDPAGRWRYGITNGRTNRGSILGDAATAVVLSTRPGFAQLLAIGSTSLSDLEEMYRGDEPLFPPATDGRPVRLGERVAQYARREPEAARTALARLQEARTGLARQTLAESGMAAADITRVLHIFAGTDVYIRSILGPLGIDPARGVLDFGRRVGHLGVNDQIAAFDHLLRTRQLRAGDHVLMMGNAIGASLSCAVVAILDDPAWEPPTAAAPDFTGTSTRNGRRHPVRRMDGLTDHGRP